MHGISQQMPEHGEIWGVIGGMGPRASAEFIKTIYERCVADREQEQPQIILLSDPSFPDRSEYLLRGDPQPLADRLRKSVETLIASGATRVVICCMTIHAVLSELPLELRSRILSLVDLVAEGVEAAGASHLILCTSGFRSCGTLEASPRWQAIRNRIVWPDARDQESIHALVYELKRGGGRLDHVHRVWRLLDRYGARYWIAGCTEFHLLTPLIKEATGRPPADLCLDPLLLAADRIAQTLACAASNKSFSSSET